MARTLITRAPFPGGRPQYPGGARPSYPGGRPSFGSVTPSDSTPPTVSNPGDSSTYNSITVTFDANELAVGKVRYGTTSGVYTVETAYETTYRTTGHSVLLSNLAASTTYFYQIAARDLAGNVSAWQTERSKATGAAPDTTPPTVTAGPTVSNITSSSADIAWTTNEASTSQVEYGPTTSYGVSYPTPADANLLTSHAVSLAQLSANTLYNYRVRSVDASGNELIGSNGTFTTLSAGDQTPPTVTAGPTVTTEDVAATIRWTTNELSDSEVEWGLTVGYGNTTTVGSSVLSHAVTLIGLTANTTYNYRIKSRDLAGNQYVSGNNTFMTNAGSDTTPPTITVGPAASGITDTAATITWTTDEASSTLVEYGLTASYGSTTALADTNPRVTNHSAGLSSLTPSTTYHYRVKSKDANLNEVVSGDFTFVTAAGADVTAPVITAGPTVSNITSSSVTITWTTNEAADTQVEYGLTASYGSTSPLTDTNPRVVNHTVVLSGLSANSLYHYRVLSRDAAGNLRTGTDGTFTTAQAGGLTQVTLTDVTSGVLASARVSVEFKSIVWELRYSGDSDNNLASTVRYKRSVDSTWRQARPGRPTNLSTDKAMYGSIWRLTHNTSYDVEITVIDGAESTVVTFTTTTRNDNYSTPTQILAGAIDRYVSMTGSDSNDGLTAGTPWATLEKAITTAPSGAVVRVDDDGGATAYYARWTTNRTTPITLIAENPACADNGVLQNPTSRVVVHDLFTSPTGAAERGDTNVGVWTQTTLTGPGNGGAPAGAQYTVWQWTGAPANVRQVHFGPATGTNAAKKRAAPTRLAGWRSVGSGLNSAAKWAEMMHTNLSYNYGFYQLNNAGTLYCRLPGDANPNDTYVWVGRGDTQGLFTFNGNDIRICGFETRSEQQAAAVGSSSLRAMIDHCYLIGHIDHVRVNDNAGDTVIRHNRMEDSSMWDETRNGIPWKGIKQFIVQADGSNYGSTRVMEWCETHAMYLRHTGSTATGVRRTVFSNNYCIGLQNANCVFHDPATTNKYETFHTAIYNNTYVNIVDDVIECEDNTIAWIIWDCTLVSGGNMFGPSVINYGPVWFDRINVYNTGNQGIRPSGRAQTAQNSPYGTGNALIKYGGTGSPAAHIDLLHITYYSTQSDQTIFPQPNRLFRRAATGTATERWHIRNCIFHCGDDIFDTAIPASQFDSNYNQYVTSQSTVGAAVTYGANDNMIDSTRLNEAAIAACFNSPSTGDLTLAVASAAINRGTLVEGTSSESDLYLGAAPDLGFAEKS